jgi:N-methylhydantoinase B
LNTRWEVVNKATEFIAEEMGVALKRSALSPNIRERMDHSCAVLTAEGKIVAQAEHIPVHLGSFKIGVENLIGWVKKESISLGDGDMVIVNDPYVSGTHLNDLMILAPVFSKRKRVAYVVNKAHIVDVGGPAPGSLNPLASNLYGEGLIIPPTILVRRSLLNSDLISILKANFKDAETALGDINAQVAANRTGMLRVRALVERFGLKEVQECWRQSIDHTAKLVRRHLSQLRVGEFRAVDYVEWGGKLLPIRLNLKISRLGIVADFTGSSPQIDAPLNAVLGVTYSAAAFAVRCMMQSSIDTNDGFYACVKVRAPLGCIVNPTKPAPVSGGNVETTQRIADLVFLALSRATSDYVPAASAGTMMNVMLGGYRPTGTFWAYYETIGGGSGGRYGENGVSAIHTNMTNTLNTPIEIAETEYPLYFTRYEIRRRSGGRGKWSGGEGIIRSFRVLRPTTLSVLADRFLRGPWGLKGGQNGRPGKITLIRERRRSGMPSKFVAQLAKGDEVTLETPGGGGFGKPLRPLRTSRRSSKS